MRALLVLVMLSWLAACRRSEAELQAEFDEFVEKHNQCETPTDCTRVGPGCPLRCIVAVRADAASRARRLAADLIDEYERFGTMCEYDCIGAWGATCLEGRCALCDQPDGGAGTECVR